MSAPVNGHLPDAVSKPNLAATSRDAVIAADDIGVTRLDPNGTADDPAWMTEQLTQTIDRQLLSLTKLLEQAPGVPDGLGDVQGWVSPNFACSQLRPTETELHQLAGGLHVHRPRRVVAYYDSTSRSSRNLPAARPSPSSAPAERTSAARTIAGRWVSDWPIRLAGQQLFALIVGFGYAQ